MLLFIVHNKLVGLELNWNKLESKVISKKENKYNTIKINVIILKQVNW